MDRLEALALAQAAFVAMNKELFVLWGRSDLTPQALRATEHAVETKHGYHQGWMTAFGHRFSPDEIAPGNQPIMD